MEYHVTVYDQLKGLNELLAGRMYNPRTRRYINYVKQSNDKQCCFYIRQQLRGIKLNPPITIHYDFFCKDKRHDRMNIASATDKSFQDALQTCGVLDNDGWNEVVNCTFNFYIDKENPRTEITIKEI